MCINRDPGYVYIWYRITSKANHAVIDIHLYTCARTSCCNPRGYSESLKKAACRYSVHSLCLCEHHAYALRGCSCEKTTSHNHRRKRRTSLGWSALEKRLLFLPPLFTYRAPLAQNLLSMRHCRHAQFHRYTCTRTCKIECVCVHYSCHPPALGLHVTSGWTPMNGRLMVRVDLTKMYGCQPVGRMWGHHHK